MPPNFENRTLYHGDNIDFLRGMDSGTIHLIATDPPFNKNRDFHATPDRLAEGAQFQDRWRWEEESHPRWMDGIKDDWPNVWSVIDLSRTAAGDDMAAFLCFMAVRLVEMHRVLRDDGSIYLHCDDTASHYLKALMDAVFGRANFRNDISWRRATSHNDPSRYGRIVDHILYYAKGREPYWNGDAITRPRNPEQIREAYPSQDRRGRYRAENMTGPSHGSPAGAPSTQPWRGYDVHARGRVWSVPRTSPYAAYIEREFIPGYRDIEGIHERLDALDAAGLVHHPERGFWPGLKRYAAADRGNPPQNLILEPAGFTNFTAGRGEHTGYPTQKPLKLYEKLILASSPPGGFVLDPFCGCATTPIAAERNGRQWVGMDIWDGAHDMVLQRLRDERLAVPDNGGEQPDNEQGVLLTFGQIHYETDPPIRTDLDADGEDAMPHLAPTPQAQEPPGPRMSRQDMFDALAANGLRCQGCDREFDDPLYLQLDHRIPRSEGGSNRIENRMLLCGPCNLIKSNTLTLTGLRAENERRGRMTRRN